MNVNDDTFKEADKKSLFTLTDISGLGIVYTFCFFQNLFLDQVKTLERVLKIIPMICTPRFTDHLSRIWSM